jgi:uncharacterized damage-inducible protein DinB
MARAAIEQLLYLLAEAFEGHGEHALLANLRDLSDGDLSWVPPGGGRSTFDILEHIGECKYVYENHAFGDGSMRWDRPGTVPMMQPGVSKEELIAWLREGQRRLEASVAALADDGDLLAQRRANWGATYETRWLVNVMIQHDLYHAGEINHLRALRQGTDRWPWEQPQA